MSIPMIFRIRHIFEYTVYTLYIIQYNYNAYNNILNIT